MEVQAQFKTMDYEASRVNFGQQSNTGQVQSSDKVKSFYEENNANGFYSIENLANAMGQATCYRELMSTDNHRFLADLL